MHGYGAHHYNRAPATLTKYLELFSEITLKIFMRLSRPDLFVVILRVIILDHVSVM